MAAVPTCSKRLGAALAALLFALPAQAASLSLSAARVEASGLVAEGLSASLAPQGRLQLELRKFASGNTVLAEKLLLRCPALRIAKGRAECADGELRAGGSAAGGMEGRFALRVQQKQSASLELQARLGGQPLKAEAQLDARQLSLMASTRNWPLAPLLKLPALKGKLPKEASLEGSLNAELQVLADAARQELNLKFSSPSLTAAEATGRYATEKLALDGSLQASRPARWFAAGDAPASAQVALAFTGGQGYVEPVFSDFGAAPFNASATLRYSPQQLEVLAFEAGQKATFKARGTALLGLAPFAIQRAEARLDEILLPAFYERFAAPFLAGKLGEDTQTSGRASAELRIVNGQPQRASLTLVGASAQAKRLDVGLSGLDGRLVWTASGQPPEDSRLVWTGGHFGELALPGSRLHANFAGDGLRLREPLRQGVLGGALRVDELVLAGLSGSNPQAQMKAEIEPIDLKDLTKALGWPPFEGQLGGKLPGLTYTGHTLALQGALTAQVFDGTVTIENLRWVEPAARSRRLTADVALRRIDLAQLTGAFSYGRIDGRVDGDVRGLKLQGFTPTAFDARLYTSPENPGRRRISQRAIDNISSLGGGPKGVVSRSVLRFFDDFAYEKLGLSCRLRDGICVMDGVEPAKDGGYVIVKGSLVPRIDVVGHSRRVDWDTFYAQLKGLRDLQTPETGVQVGR